MNREFLNLYNQELQILNDQAKEFAEEFPGIAERLGGLVGDQMDPMVQGLLQGSAFLAARVQLKLKHEFPEFTNNLLEQLVPNYLTPTPSVLLAQARPVFGDPALREGRRIPTDSYLDATYRERDRRVACRYRLTAPIELWPLEIREAEYLPAIAPLEVLGLPLETSTVAGLKIGFSIRSAPTPEDEPTDEEMRAKPELWAAGLKISELPLHFLGNEAEAGVLYEQIFAHCTGVALRYLDAFGDPVVRRLDPGCVHQIGFGDSEQFFFNDRRVFRGFDLLREYFVFSRKFLGMRISGLGDALRSVQTRHFELIFQFSEIRPQLAALIKPGTFALYAAPAVNLFEMSTDRIPVKSNQHEFHVVPDRSRALEYEAHRVLEVYAHYAGGRKKQPVQPLYSAPAEGMSQSRGLHYTVRRLPRRRSSEEKLSGGASDYTGTDLFISLSEGTGLGNEAGVAELSLRALCSNRHLPEQLPVGESGADFRLIDDVALDIRCLAGPTPPKEPLLSRADARRGSVADGAAAWRLISFLSLNHLGLLDRAAGANAQSLREMLAFFADQGEAAIERRIRGVRSIDARPIVRRLRQRIGSGVARGTEITVTLDEKAFEGASAFLLGAVLDRFFTEYVNVNHFTQLVVKSADRGIIKRWPPRAGMRRVL